MRKGFRDKKIFISISIVFMLGTYVLIWYWHHRAINGLRVTSLDVSAKSLALKDEIGYGGLIHNFKNAVLRPDEPKYFDEVLKNGIRANAIISELESEAREHKVELDFTESRKMIVHYTRDVDQVARLTQQGHTPEEIDEQVRFDDTQALKEAAAAQSALLSRLEQEMDEIERISTALASAGTLFMLGFIILISRRILSEQKRIDAIKLATKNAELEIANDQLESANTALKQFAGIASHDLKAPARQMGMFADIILEDQSDAALVKECADQIKTASEHMQELVKSLLIFTKTAYQIPLKKTVDMNEVVDHAVYVTTHGLKTQPEIQVEPLPDCPVDKVLVQRIWENLIGNALKYQESDSAPKIRIAGLRNETEKSCDYIIEDNGIGIDSSYADIIFDPLKRLHGENSGFEGQGIGLALVKSVIEAHGGTIWLDQTFTSGARFCFRLPAV